MMHLITGGSGSGKSEYAESRVLSAGLGRRIYIATMIPCGEEGRQRVERHRALRREKQFETVECYTGLGGLSLTLLHTSASAAARNVLTSESAAGRSVLTSGSAAGRSALASESADDHDTEEQDRIVLLECISNLVANEVFEQDGAREQTVEAVCEGVKSLQKQAKELFIVTNEVFSDGITYDAETMRYLSYLGVINQKLAEMAGEVTEIVYGIPVRIK